MSVANRQSHLLVAESLAKTYDTGPVPVQAVKQVDLVVDAGSFLVVRGRSGSGKTTLLNMLGTLDVPTGGTVELDGVNLAILDETEKARLRRDTIGFIFQAFGLLPILTAVENVEIPLRLVGTPSTERRDRAMELLERVGLGQRAEHRPHELSGGEQQRVAIARALVNSPSLLLADEPTGQLDSRTGADIVRLIKQFVVEVDVAAVVATHDPALLAVADQVVEMRDGVAVPVEGMVDPAQVTRPR